MPIQKPAFTYISNATAVLLCHIKCVSPQLCQSHSHNAAEDSSDYVASTFYALKLAQDKLRQTHPINFASSSATKLEKTTTIILCQQ